MFLEDLDQREFAETGPRGFLDGFSEGAILDEVQCKQGQSKNYSGIISKDKFLPRIYALTRKADSQHPGIPIGPGTSGRTQQPEINSSDNSIIMLLITPIMIFAAPDIVFMVQEYTIP